MRSSSPVTVLERNQLTDEVEGEKELEVKALGEELAGELGLGQGHLMRFCWWSELAETTPFIDLGQVLFSI